MRAIKGNAAVINASMRPLATIIAENAKKNPHGIAFIAMNEGMSWGDYHARSHALAAFLIHAGFQQGERIAFLLPDGIEIHLAFVACEKAGLVAVGISPRAGEKEIAHILTLSGAVALFAYREHGQLNIPAAFAKIKCQSASLRSLILMQDAFFRTVAMDNVVLTISDISTDHANERQIGIDELFLINSTSGTTGMPKCVAHHQQRWFQFAHYALDSAPLGADDIFLCAVPASVGFGLWSAHFLPALLGAKTILLPKFTLEALLDAIGQYRVSVISAVSTQLIMLMSAIEQSPRQYDLGSLRILYTGGEPVPYERARQFELVTNAKVLQFYGSNEAGGLSYTSCGDSQEKRLRTAGRVIPAMNVRVLDSAGNANQNGEGQPICHGPLNSLGYFNDIDANKKLFTPDGFMKLDDVVRIDQDGYLSVVGRVGDFIIRGGKNISAAAVEENALTFPGISAAAAVGMPDEVFGEKVCLYVTTIDNAEIRLEAMTDFLLQRGTSKENLPEYLVVLDQLPIVSGGKVAKQKLREDIRQRLAHR